MCGRYHLWRPPAELTEYSESVSATPNHPPTWNMAPTQEGLVLRRHPEAGARHLGVLRWGLVPHWAKDAAGAARLINARAEGLAEKPSFREAFAKRRCLVPMDGFYEWRAEGGAKQAYAVALRSGRPMLVAGLWEGWKQPDGNWLRTYTVITTASNPKQALVHPRMPAILPPARWDAWLGAEPATEAALLAMLTACPAESLAIWPVDNRVGKVAENDAGLLLRKPGAAPPPELDDAPPY
jgi:putative SOS response-associated peptidase YedK